MPATPLAAEQDIVGPAIAQIPRLPIAPQTGIVVPGRASPDVTSTNPLPAPQLPVDADGSQSCSWLKTALEFRGLPSQL